MNDNTSMTITNDNKNMPQNRAQRRAMAKLQKKRNKMIMNYIKKHPEAVKVELDEKKIEELENEEANLTIKETTEEDVMTSGYVQVGEPQSVDLSQVETISSNDRGHRIELEPVDEVCDMNEDEKNSTTTNFTPVKKNTVVKN
jgi:septum formation topological specificity factor MinE